jgi:CubicO group peptidase (beta-lactamase class C family)
VSQATGKTLSGYLSEKIWKPYGMETDALWAVDLSQHEMGGCCLSASLRDYARYGQFMLGGAKINGQAIVPDDWIENATSIQEKFNVNIGFNGDVGYGYQWWAHKNGSYMAMGLFGQIIFIDPNNNLVIVMLGNTPRFSPGREGIKNRLGFLLWAIKATEENADMSKVKP